MTETVRACRVHYSIRNLHTLSLHTRKQQPSQFRCPAKHCHEMLNQKILKGTSSSEVKRILESRRRPGLPWAFPNSSSLAGGGLSLGWYCWGYGSRTSDSSRWLHQVACEDLPGAGVLWGSKKRRQPACVQEALAWFPWLPGCAGSWTVLFGFPGRVEFSSVIHSLLLLSEKPSIGGKKRVEFWNTFHLWQRKAFTFHMKL